MALSYKDTLIECDGDIMSNSIDTHANERQNGQEMMQHLCGLPCTTHLPHTHTHAPLHAIDFLPAHFAATAGLDI